MKLTLKNIKYFAEMSEETPCYRADLYMDGEYVATAKNSGCGGSTDIHYVNGINSAETQRLEEYAKTHPVVFNYQGEEYKFYGVDHIVDTLFDSWMEKQ